MIIITFVILVVMAFGFFGLIFLGLLGSANKNTQKNSEKILDETFDGKETAVYKITSLGGLKFEQVLSGAEKRGYDLHAQNQDNSSMTTLVFKKAV